MKKCILRCLFSLAVVCATLLIEACKETPPEPSKQPTLSLSAEDASCTEAWLKVSCTELPATIRLQILTPTTQTKQTIRLTTTDSLLIDEGLLPNRTYTYQLQRLNADSTVIETSTSVQVTTMDTTSHNFSWRIDTLGVTSSVLYDVAIVSDNDVWAVGEIFLNDSRGNLTQCTTTQHTGTGFAGTFSGFHISTRAVRPMERFDTSLHSGRTTFALATPRVGTGNNFTT